MRMHREVLVGCVTAANHMNLLIIGFDFRRGGGVFGLWPGGSGNEQEVKTESWQLSCHPAPSVVSANGGYFSISNTRTLASSILTSVDSGTGGVRITCFGTIT